MAGRRRAAVDMHNCVPTAQGECGTVRRWQNLPPLVLVAAAMLGLIAGCDAASVLPLRGGWAWARGVRAWSLRVRAAALPAFDGMQSVVLQAARKWQCCTAPAQHVAVQCWLGYSWLALAAAGTL